MTKLFYMANIFAGRRKNMKGKRKSVIVLGIIILLMVGAFRIGFVTRTDEEYFEAGSSSLKDETAIQENPTEINDWYELDGIRDDLDGDYVLMNDLDEDTDGYDDLVDTEDGWEPIGEFPDEFEGTFNGQNHTISGLYIDRDDEEEVGLFGRADSDTFIEKVNLVDVEITGYEKVGGIVGRTWGDISNSSVEGSVSGIDDDVGGLLGRNAGSLRNSHAKGEVSGAYYVGGLVGNNGFNSVIDNSHATADVSGERYIGGLVGQNHDGMVKNSYATGDVTGEYQLGGLVGYNYYGDVIGTYSTGEVTGDGNVGGLLGKNFNGLVENSYTRGDVSGSSTVGGLVGETFRGTVNSSYAAGSVSGSLDVGGLVGENDEGTVDNSFWDLGVTGQDESDGGRGKTTEEMKNVETYTDTDTEGLDEPWDFVGDPNDDGGDEDIWDMDGANEGYPFLTWEERETGDSDDGIPGSTLTFVLAAVVGLMITVMVFVVYYTKRR